MKAGTRCAFIPGTQRCSDRAHSRVADHPLPEHGAASAYFVMARTGRVSCDDKGDHFRKTAKQLPVSCAIATSPHDDGCKQAWQSSVRIVERTESTKDYYVVGLGLPASCRHALCAAYPRSILYSAGLNPCSEMKDLCDLLGRVVLFTYIPAMPLAGWLRVSAIFQQESVKVVGVHPLCTDAIYDAALEAEFAGVLDADADAATYRRAVLSVRQDELWFPRGYLSRRTRESLARTSPGGLSEREADVLALLGGGHTNQDIADSLCISRDTVRWHLRSIYGKLGVSDREAAHRLAKNKLASSSR